MKQYIFNFLLIIFFIGLGAGQEMFAHKSLQSAVNQYIAKEAKTQEAVKSKKDRQIVMGDLDGDGDKDAIVQFTLEGFGGGNNWTQSMAVFINKKSIYKFADEKTVGGKFFTYTSTLSGVLKREVLLNTETCTEPPQGMCENPKRGTAKFAFRQGKLSEL